MIKKWVAYIACALLGVYLVCFFVVLLSSEEGVCKGVEITVLDDDMRIISPDYIKDHLVKNGIDPVSQPLDSTLCANVEKSVNELSMIDECRCYKTHKDIICIKVSYKRPVMHIINNKGEDFYIDSNGDVIDERLNAMYLPLATGFIEKEAVDGGLVAVANILAGDEFWKKQTAQIYLDENKELILIPRVGEHVIEIGHADNFDAKLAKLKDFYQIALNEIGWNKHSKLNVEFEDQVICTIKEK